VDTLQVALNLLDHRMMPSVLPEAREHNVGVLARSAFLKGALTERARLLPGSLQALAEASNRAREVLEESWESMPGTAVRFCLAVPGIHSVLIGLRSAAELAAALAAEKRGALPDAIMRKAEVLKLNDESLLNPSHWPSL
jgi:hypothetical protein